MRGIKLRDKALVSWITLLCAVTLISGTTILPVTASASYAASFSFLPASTSSNTIGSNLHFVSHKVSHADPPLQVPAATSPIASSSPSNIQITAGRVQQISFNINTNNALGGPFMVPSVLTNLAVTLASQNTSVRILGPSSWNLPSIPSSGKVLTTDVFASTSLISSPVFFTVSIQYIQNNHDVKSASFNLGGIVVGSIQLGATSLGIRYIGNTPNLVGNILNEGNTPAQFASVEMIQQPNSQFPTTSVRQLSSILAPTSSQYLGNIAVNSPVPFNIPLQAVSSSKAQTMNSPTGNTPSERTTTPPFTKTALEQSNDVTGTDNSPFPGTYPVSIRVTYVDDLKNTRETIINSSVNVPNTQPGSNAPKNTDSGSIRGENLPAQLDSQMSTTNGFVDAYWASNTARVTNGNGTISASSLQATPVPVQQEIAPGDGQSILAVELTNTEFSTINGITAYLTLPPGFSSTNGGLVSNNVSPVSASSSNQGQQPHQQQIAVATYNNVVTAGQMYTLYFKVNVDRNATLGSHLASLTLYYFRVPELQPGLYRTQNFAVPFVLPGRVILDTIPTTTSLNPGVSNVAKIMITNMGTATAHGVIVTITSISGNSISSTSSTSSGTTSSGTTSSGTNSTTTTPGAQITSITPPSTIPTVNIGARTFDIGTIQANGRVEIDPIVYPAYSSGGTLQNVNLQITYTNSVGQSLASTSSVGYLVQPTPPQAGITINPATGATISPSIGATTGPSSGQSNHNTSITPNSTSTSKPANLASTTNGNGLTKPSSNIQSPHAVNSIKPTHPPLSNSTSRIANNSGSKNPGLSRTHSNSPSAGISVSPAGYSGFIPKAFASLKDKNNNNGNNGTLHLAQLVFTGKKVEKPGIQGTTDTTYTQKQDPPARAPGLHKGTPQGTNLNQQANSSSLILVSGNTEDMQFSVSNNNDLPITNAVVSIASETSGLKIVGDTLWSIPNMAPHTTRIFATKIYASTTLIAQPVSFLVTMQYISQGQSQVGSFTLGGTVIGSIKVSANGIGINYIAGIPNLIGNLLNEGNTIGLYTTVQLINQPFPANGTAGSSQQQHHHGQSGTNNAGSNQGASSSTNTSSTNSPPASLPPPQYLGDLQPDSPLPFSIPLTVNVNNTAQGVYPVKLQVTYSDDLKNSHTVILNNSVQVVHPQVEQNSGQSGGILGYLTGSGGAHGRGGHHGAGGGGGSRGFLGLPLLFWIVIIAIIIIALLYIRRRRKRSKAALLAASTTIPDESGPSEDIESLIDGSHKSLDPKKEE